MWEQSLMTDFIEQSKLISDGFGIKDLHILTGQPDGPKIKKHCSPHMLNLPKRSSVLNAGVPEGAGDF